MQYVSHLIWSDVVLTGRHLPGQVAACGNLTADELEARQGERQLQHSEVRSGHSLRGRPTHAYINHLRSLIVKNSHNWLKCCGWQWDLSHKDTHIRCQFGANFTIHDIPSSSSSSSSREGASSSLDLCPFTRSWTATRTSVTSLSTSADSVRSQMSPPSSLSDVAAGLARWKSSAAAPSRRRTQATDAVSGLSAASRRRKDASRDSRAADIEDRSAKVTRSHSTHALVTRTVTNGHDTSPLVTRTVTNGLNTSPLVTRTVTNNLSTCPCWPTQLLTDLTPSMVTRTVTISKCTSRMWRGDKL